MDAIEQFASGRAVPPIEKASFAAGVALDHVEPGHATGHLQHLIGAYAFTTPGCEHLLTQAIVSERGDIGGIDAEPRQIHSGVERIAAETAREQAAAGGR